MTVTALIQAARASKAWPFQEAQGPSQRCSGRAKPALIQAARASKAWPFQEAQRLLKRYPEGRKPDGAPVLFETGYGPSGLPHIGTFQEVARTTMVRRAFELLTGGAPTRLVAFSDDMDGLRKVPENLPNGDMLRSHLG